MPGGSCQELAGEGGAVERMTGEGRPLWKGGVEGARLKGSWATAFKPSPAAVSSFTNAALGCFPQVTRSQFPPFLLSLVMGCTVHFVSSALRQKHASGAACLPCGEKSRLVS